MFLLKIAREDDNAFVFFDLLQQVSHFDVGVAVVRVLHFRAFAEKRVGFVEEKYRVAALGGAKDAIEIFLRLANVFADQTGEIDLIEVEPEFASDDTGGHRFAGARSAGKKHFEPHAGGDSLLKSPF